MVSDGYAFLVEMLFEAQPARLPHRRSADHLRRAAPGPVEAVELACSSSRSIMPVAPAASAGAAADHAPRRRDGDDVVSPVSRGQRRHVHGADRDLVAARGHEVHIVAPWHPLVAASRGGERRPLPLLQVRARPRAERLRLRRRAARRRQPAGARRTSPRRWRSRPGGARRARSRGRIARRSCTGTGSCPAA